MTHVVEVEGPLPQLCDPFEPAHFTAHCTCGRFYIGFGAEDVERWTVKHRASAAEALGD